MFSKAPLFLFFLFLGLHCSVVGQTIRGEVTDLDSKHAVVGVNIENIYTSLAVTTNSDGSFVIAASGDQLLEFKKTGYKTVRVRVPNGYMPSYFKIIMQHGITNMHEVNEPANNRYVYRSDSLRYHDLYKHELDFPKLSGIGAVAHPFSALSTRNREIWKFQEDYNDFEKEKYIDRTFNAETITKFTGLKGDSLKYFMVRYRPEYEQLRTMNDYTFFNYIKKTAHTYRNRNASQRGAQ